MADNAGEAGATMTFARALHLYRTGVSWLGERLKDDRPCGCGSCHICAYNYLEGAAAVGGLIPMPGYAEGALPPASSRQLYKLLHAFHRANVMLDEARAFNDTLRQTVQDCGTRLCGEQLGPLDLYALEATRDEIAAAMTRLYGDFK